MATLIVVFLANAKERMCNLGEPERIFMKDLSSVVTIQLGKRNGDLVVLC